MDQSECFPPITHSIPLPSAPIPLRDAGPSPAIAHQPPPSPFNQPKALDCCQHYSSLRAQSAPTRPPPFKPPPHQLAEGSGLLGESQLSPRTKCAYPPPSPQAPSEPASRRLWTAGRITALSAHGVRLPALSSQARDREAPYSRLSPQAPSEPASRRLWTAVSITALSAHKVRLPALSEHARDPESRQLEPVRWCRHFRHPTRLQHRHRGETHRLGRRRNGTELRQRTASRQLQAQLRR